MIREEIRVKGSARGKGAHEGLGVLPILFLAQKIYTAVSATQSGVSSFHVFCSSNSKPNQEDKGAGEGLGLQRFEWLTSCVIDDVSERGLTSGECENFDSDENVGL